MISRHDCKPHEYQDKVHGANNRVVNQMKDPDRVRCTVCNAIIDIKGKQAVVLTPKK